MSVTDFVCVKKNNKETIKISSIYGEEKTRSLSVYLCYRLVSLLLYTIITVIVIINDQLTKWASTVKEIIDYLIRNKKLPINNSTTIERYM